MGCLCSFYFYGRFQSFKSVLSIWKISHENLFSNHPDKYHVGEILRIARSVCCAGFGDQSIKRPFETQTIFWQSFSATLD